MKKWLLVQAVILLLCIAIGFGIGWTCKKPKVVEVVVKEPVIVESEPKQEVEVSQVVSNVEKEESFVNDEDLILLAKTVYGEARGCSTVEQAAVIWCILNRVDSQDSYYPDTIKEVIMQKNQFVGYSASNPVLDEYYNLALDVVNRWKTENQEGRVLPKEYLFFHGDGNKNFFRTKFEHDGNYWGWSLPNPYDK